MENENTAKTETAETAPPADDSKTLEGLEAELKEQKNKYLYLYADFETYKNRALKERSELMKFGHSNLMRDLLQVSDNLERALSHTENTEALITGLKMVHQQLKDSFTKYGLKEINSLGESFDPQIHEAVAQYKVGANGNGHKDGDIVEEHQKGYRLHDRLLRPARVVVATNK